MASFSHTVPVQASPARVWALVRDVQRVAGLFSYLQVDDVCSPQADCWVFDRQLSLPNVANLRWREHAQIVREGELQFHALGGDLTTFDGHWLVTPTGETATLTLALEYVIPEAHAPRMPAALVGYVMGQIFTSICDRVREAAEEDAE
ncbi:MAG TPA: SRPBCC family protein [Armatimonadota bacterium]